MLKDSRRWGDGDGDAGGDCNSSAGGDLRFRLCTLFCIPYRYCEIVEGEGYDLDGSGYKNGEGRHERGKDK